MSVEKFFEKYNKPMLFVMEKISSNKYICTKNNKFSRFIKLQIIKILFKSYNYPISQGLYAIIGIDYLDLRKIELPKNRDLFFMLCYFNYSGKTKCVYDVKLPYIDYNYYNCSGVCFKESIFTKPDKEEDLQSFILSVHSLNKNSPVSVPFADYSNVSFKGVNISKMNFHKDCILPDDVNFFQKISMKDASETELPLTCLSKLHLYDLNGVKINLDLHKWYTEVLTQSQINIIKKKYPTQIGANIILPKEV